jgi:hypothetical protein
MHVVRTFSIKIDICTVTHFKNKGNIMSYGWSFTIHTTCEGGYVSHEAYYGTVMYKIPLVHMQVHGRKPF